MNITNLLCNDCMPKNIRNTVKKSLNKSTVDDSSTVFMK